MNFSLEQPEVAPEAAIPIRNIWHMLVYAWRDLPLNALCELDVEQAPSLDALFAKLLVRLMQRRLRMGLGRAYTPEHRTIRGIRGRIAVTSSLRHLAMRDGQTICDFHTWSNDVTKNQIIKSTLIRLVRGGYFGRDEPVAEGLRHEMRLILRWLEDVHGVELTPSLIHRQEFGRNDADYRLMMSVCLLLLNRWMPTQSEGSARAPAVRRDLWPMHNLYEKFVAEFYRENLHGWTVRGQPKMPWVTTQDSPYLPTMRPDLVLTKDEDGRMIVLDTKYTAGSLVTSQFGSERFDSGHLYQMYAYLRSQEDRPGGYRDAAGVLLYPAVDRQLNEQVVIQGHPLRIATVDLTLPWDQVEECLLAVVR